MIELKNFYFYGFILMGLATIFNVWNFINQFSFLSLPQKLAFVFGTIFLNMLFTSMFFMLWKTTPNFQIKDSDKFEKELLKSFQN
jgi:hypothetical protein